VHGQLVFGRVVGKDKTRERQTQGIDRMTKNKKQNGSLAYKKIDRLQLILGFYHFNNGLRRVLGYRRVPILMYHSVGGPILSRYNLSVDAFTSQMEFLSNHYRFVRLKDIPRQLKNYNTKNPKLPVVITFDDGYRDLYEHVHPIMEALRIPYTVFIPTAYIQSSGSYDNENLPMLSVREILELSGSDLVDIGSHTVTHCSLTQLSSSELKEELHQSKEYLESLLSRPVDMFAYPYGTFTHYSKKIVRAVAECGYSLAVTACFSSMNRSGNNYLLRRLFFEEKDIPKTMQAKLEGKYDWYFYAEFIDSLVMKLGLRSPE
jgi:peptidoglycan/xylan/chitin deacetylase (PgdA/CDA1 family)